MDGEYTLANLEKEGRKKLPRPEEWNDPLFRIAIPKPIRDVMPDEGYPTSHRGINATCWELEFEKKRHTPFTGGPIGSWYWEFRGLLNGI